MKTIVRDAAQSDNPNALDLAVEEGARRIQRGELVAFPTETVYGLGADALNATAVAAIFQAKGRPPQNPLIVHVDSSASAEALAALWPPAARRLAEAFWPGPLTLVAHRGALIPDIVTAGGPTVALRVPSHPVAHALIRASGRPIAAPSANLSGSVSPTLAAHVLESLGGRIPFIIDGGPAYNGVESTIVDITGTLPRLLRPGPISIGRLQEEVGPVERLGPTGAPDGPLRSPGLMSRHYAPRARLEVSAEPQRRMEELRARGERVGIICSAGGTGAQELASTGSADALEQILPGNAEDWEPMLYIALHALDAAGVDVIVVERPPDSDSWMAIRDRLTRASAPAD